jgi:peptidoglycan/xylan/chitin deacetylase (PgdA/CDA1 family)
MSNTLTRALGALLSPKGARGRLAVFCYHQVLEEKDPLRPSEPDRAEFLADLEIIGRMFNVLPLPEAVEKLASGVLPLRAACITFDDGYANNHAVAAPLLERKGLPATFYIAAGAIDTGVMFNDLIIEAVRLKGSDWILGDLAKLGDGIDGEVDSGRLITHILRRLKYWPMEERWKLTSSFFRTNTEKELPRLMMVRSAVADLVRRGFDVGGHTVQHPILKELPEADARAEIAGSHAWIEEVTGKAPVSFAYPNGIPGRDFGPEHAQMVMEAGFTSAVSTFWGVAASRTDVYSMPRVGPWWRLGSSLTSGLVRTYGRSWLLRRQ